MNNSLNVAIVSLPIIWSDREGNLANVAKAIEELRPSTDLVCLPELFSTGFIAEEELLGVLAETDQGPTLTALRTLAAKHCVAITGSYLSRNADSTKFYNRAFLIEPNGDTRFCNKRHLFCLSPEAKTVTAGQQPYICTRFRGWNIAVGVCYDLRFPVWCRNRIEHGQPLYDIFVFVANWPESRGYAFKTLLCARAIENQAYTIGANRAGIDDYGEYNGQSHAIDFMGHPIVNSEGCETIYFTAQREPLESARRKLPAMQDADSFTLNY